MSNDNRKNAIDQVFSINQSDNLAGSNILNNNANLDNLNLDNFDNNNFNSGLIDAEQNNEAQNPEENPEPSPEEEEEPQKDPEEEQEEAEEVNEVEVKKVDEQEKYFLQKQIEKMKSIKAQKEIETEGDLEEISHDDGAENAKLVFEAEIRHPRKYMMGNLKKFDCCCTNVGCFGCSKKYLSSDLDKYGIGLMSYFKTLKSLLWSLFIIVLLHAIVYVIYILTHMEEQVNTINDALFKTTIGNMASTLFNCYKTPRDNLQFVPSYNFKFNCSDYQFVKINTFGLSSKLTDDINNQANCVNFTSTLTLATESSCNLQPYINKLSTEKCVKKSTCEVSVPTSEIFKQCPIFSNNNYIYLSYMCDDPIIELGSLLIDRPSLSYILVSLDAVSVLIILITIIILRCDYSKLNKSFKQSHKLINQYTINVKNLQIDFDNVDVEVDSLLSHFDVLIRQSLKIEYLKGKTIHLKNLNIQKDPNGAEYIKINIGRTKSIKSSAERKKVNDPNANYDYNNNNDNNNLNLNFYNNNDGYNNLNDLGNNQGNNFNNDLNAFAGELDNFDPNAYNNNFNYNNNDNIIQKEKIYDFGNEVNFPTYIYEINYPYLSDNKLSLILKREQLLNEFIMKNSRMKKLRKERNFGAYSNPAEKKDIENKNEADNREGNNGEVDLDNNFNNELNLDNLDNLDDILNLDNNNNLNGEENKENENGNNNPEDANLKVELKPQILLEPSAMEKYEHSSLMKELKALKKKIFEIVDKLKTLEINNSAKVNDILITFLEPKYSRFIYASYNKNKCTRCCYIFCCRYNSIKRFYYKNSWLQIQKNPDNPSNIKWQNMLVSPCNKCISKFFSILLSFFLILIGFGIILSSKYFQDVLNEEFDNNINCAFVQYTEKSVITEFLRTDIPKRNRIQTFCFCKDLLGTVGITKAYEYAFPNVIVEKQIVTPCKEWVLAYLKFNSITYAITIIIPVLNALITFILTKLTQVEKNKSLTSDKSSNMFKIFIGQFINTGLNLLIVNANIPAIREWNKNFPILNGVYSDFNSGWFKNVGCTIFFTMIISIVTPHLGILIEAFIRCVSRLCDSSNLIGKGSKLADSKSFMELYVGPELMIDSRYAQILSVYFVSLLYSSGVPGLYVSMFLTLLLCYWIDKWLFLTFYKIPPKYDLSLSRSFAFSLIFSLVLHCAFAIWIFGSPQLVADPSSQNFDFLNMLSTYFKFDLSNTNSYSTIVLQRLLVTHNLVLSALIILLVLYLVLRYTFLEIFIMICCSRGRKTNSQKLIQKRKKVTNILDDLPIHGIYNIYELRTLQIEKLRRKYKRRECKYYEEVYLNNLERERIAMKERLVELNSEDLRELNSEEFDENIRNVMENLTVFDERGIKSDFSYNLAHVEEYRNYAIANYKM